MPGRIVLQSIGTSVEVTADGNPEAKSGGITLDWTTVAAVGADTTLMDGVVVKAGDKFLRYGQVVSQIAASGLYGPFDPAATDGRQTLANGTTYVLNRTAIASEPNDAYPNAIFGGRVWRDRIIQSGTGVASLAAGPTLAALLGALPRLQLVTGG